jgi:hypothetical protein
MVAAKVIGIVLMATIALPGCSIGCPSPMSRDALSAYAASHPSLLVGYAHVVRFVPTLEPATHGYDLALFEEFGAGDRAETVFLRTPREMQVARGDTVVLIGVRTVQPLLLLPGDCPALTTVTWPQ